MDCMFIVSLSYAYRVTALTIVLSWSLQKVNQDLFEAMESYDSVLTTMDKLQQGGDDQNGCNDDERVNDDGVYSDANRLAQIANITLNMPRLVGRQTCCNNTASRQKWYKWAIWYLFLDCMQQSLQEKYSSDQMTLLKLVAIRHSLTTGLTLLTAIACIIRSWSPPWIQSVESACNQLTDHRHHYGRSTSCHLDWSTSTYLLNHAVCCWCQRAWRKEPSALWQGSHSPGKPGKLDFFSSRRQGTLYETAEELLA